MHLKAIVASVLFRAAAAQLGPFVQLAAGNISGTTCPNSPTQLFQGIPFAQPPTGKLRFMPPQPLDKPYAGGVFEANKPPSPCIQWGSEFDVDVPTPSEDCLYLNVYVPPDATPASSLPVKVWAYGGGNIGGAITYPLYDACNLATDAVVVSFNYRLGPLGFLALDTAGVRGNMAIQDYLAALGWVKENIAGFGGDPTKVLLFGQSAGADNGFTVSTLPQAKSLISAAVLESGAGQDATPYDTARLTGASYAQALNCSSTDLACLQSKSVDSLIAAYGNTPALAPGFLNGVTVSESLVGNFPNTTTLSGAVLDGEIIKRQPLEVGSQVPIIVGSNEFDASLFVLPVYGLDEGSLTEENYTSFLAQWGPASSAVGQEYPLSRFNTSGVTSQAVVDAISHVVNMASFTCTTYKALRAAVAADTPAYAYRFNHTPSCPWLWFSGTAFPGASLADFFLSTHTAELPFVFANLENQPWGNGTCNASSSEYALSKTLTSAWTSMAANGDPSTSLQSWPRFGDCDTNGLFIQDAPQVTGLDFSECQFWESLYANFGGAKVGPPSNTSCTSNTTSGGSGSSNQSTAAPTTVSASGVAVMGPAFGYLGLLWACYILL